VLTFAWPWGLLALAAVPLVVLWYRRLVRARAARRAELAALGFTAPARGAPWKRTLPAALLLSAVVLLLAALARPEIGVPLPRREGTVLLAFDVSSSMTATDLTPTRMEAAKAAARTVVERQPPTVLVGVIAFGGSGLVTQQPTADRASVLAAIDRLQPSGGTALGSGLQTALSTITGRAVIVDVSGSPGGSGGVEPQGPDLGYHGSAAVVLFSDGENTAEPDPMAVAELASSAGVRVYPVGIGSPRGTVIEVDGFQLATALDEPTLRAIAERTDGRYVAAADTPAVAGVADAIDLEWKVQTEHIEVTALLAATAGLLVLVAAGLALAWSGRVI
jgi:Ca-activated chloride channel family protein